MLAVMEVWSNNDNDNNGNANLDNNWDPSLDIDVIPNILEEVLCSERVSRVTRTYQDIEAVTHLLEEKERDLELAARIGQCLLKQKVSLVGRNEYLEDQLEKAKEEVAQLRHEVSMREDLLQLYANTAEESDSSSISTPLRRSESSPSVQDLIHLDFLQQKLQGLEKENQQLRTEATEIENEMTQYEEVEEQLMFDCVQELAEAHGKVAALSDELTRKVEDTARQQEEISHLLTQVVNLQQKCKACTRENEELKQHLEALKEAHRQLKTEFTDLQEKYAECKEMLVETQDEIKNLRNRSLPNSTISRYSSLNIFPLDCLAAEIEGTMRKGIDSFSSSEHLGLKRVFETVKVANRAGRCRSGSHSPQSFPGSSPPSEMLSTTPSHVNTPRSSLYCSDTTSTELDDKSQALVFEPEASQTEAHEKKRGMPGTPGSHDLKVALRRLAVKQEGQLSDKTYFEMEQERKRKKLSNAPEFSSGFLTPNESVISSGTNLSTGTNYSGCSELTGGSSFSFGSRSYFPDKLQIVKPLEGSATLYHWQQLAKPNLGGILDPRPGVLTKDFHQLDTDVEEVYNLNDFEEDEVDLNSFRIQATSSPLQNKQSSQVFHSSNNLPQTQSTYTFTNCRILHPSNFTTVTPSGYNTSVPSCGSSENIRSTRLHFQRTRRLSESSTNAREHTTTLSTSLGLVKILKDCGISAAVYNPTYCSRHAGLAQSGVTLPFVQNSGLSLQGPTTLHFASGYRRPFIKPFLGSDVTHSILNGDKNTKETTHLKEGQTERSIFSFNLVEQLKKLGLDKVIARGIVSSQNTAGATKS
ncbi:trafficking kinesin-binding protein 1-like isoform X2 [Protopterus annectens]|uniref:trafficking kinesin-binding protein 1-like isoform X2 n=1 Tax=Protopterus annectens TaxID=7888 RepID=UPI001CFB56EC|nr:trafficking kinesin-binding protein 1-like isoform X2 [Protopterus annectens]